MRERSDPRRKSFHPLKIHPTRLFTATRTLTRMSGSPGALQVWLAVEDDDAWVLSSVVATEASEVRLKRLHAPAGWDREVRISRDAFEALSKVTGDYSQPGDDLVALPDVNAGSMLHTLRHRFEQDDIYTAIGPVLVAINPYQPVSTCSSENFARLKNVATAEGGGTPSKELTPPHIFKIALAAYVGMLNAESRLNGGMAQSILISGETGAGKTETNKLCMSCLAELSGGGGTMTEAALESGVLLEAFGNARTVFNHNSSRFGKWCAVYFDADGKMAACKVSRASAQAVPYHPLPPLTTPYHSLPGQVVSPGEVACRRPYCRRGELSTWYHSVQPP